MANISVKDLSKRSPVKYAKMCHTWRISYQGADDDRMARSRQGGYGGKVHMQPDQDLVDEVVHSILAAAQPLKIMLFGSAARGTMGPGSDLDLLVVVPDGTLRRQTAQDISMHLFGQR